MEEVLLKKNESGFPDEKKQLKKEDIQGVSGEDSRHNLISVIVPFYNSEEYLEEAVVSVIEQDYRELEIILVDDLSTDNSLQLAEDLRIRDSRIRILRHTENRGVGPARNSGVEKASGEYLIFLDSDDYFKPGALKLLWQAAVRENIDVVIGSCDQVDEEGVVSDHDRISDSGYEGGFGVIEGGEAVRRWLRMDGMFVPVRPWGILIKTDMYKRSGLTFFPGDHEDLSLTPFLYYFAGEVVYLEDVVLTYRIRMGSIINTPQSVARMENYRKVWDYTRERLGIYGMEEYREEFKRFHLGHVIYRLENGSWSPAVLDTAAVLIKEKLSLAGGPIKDEANSELRYFLDKAVKILQKAEGEGSYMFWESIASHFSNEIILDFIRKKIDQIRNQIWRVPMSNEMGRDDLLQIEKKLSSEEVPGGQQEREISALKAENEHLRKKLIEISYYLNIALSNLERRSAVSAGQDSIPIGKLRRSGPSALIRRFMRLPGIRSVREPGMIKAIGQSGQFSPEFYRETYKDLAGYQGDLLLHFVRFGGYEGRSPNRYFDSKWYLNANPGVGKKGINPLYHYLKIGRKAGLWPSPDYSPGEYEEMFGAE